MLKYLRIAVTALSLTVCVLLIALWVRSYFYWDSVYWYPTIPQQRSVNSVIGRLMFRESPGINGWYENNGKWKLRSSKISDREAVGHRVIGRNDFLGFNRSIGALVTSTSIPYWFLILLVATAGIIAALPWLRWHFSLPTLLIATTLVAVGLGIVVVFS